MNRLEVVIAGFGDEYSYNAEEHLKFLGDRNIPISVRFFSFADEARQSELEKLTKDEFNEVTNRLKAERKIKHITEATTEELQRYKKMMADYGVIPWDIGSQIGKQYLGDANHSTDFLKKLEKTIMVAHYLGAKRIRVFNFYPGKKGQLEESGTDSFKRYRKAALGYVKFIGNRFKKEKLFGFLEVEANLLGRDGKSLVDFLKEANMDNLFLYFDGANMVVQDENKIGLSLITYHEMAASDYLGGLHIKEAKYSKAKDKKVDEEAPWLFVPVGKGNADYDIIFNFLARGLIGITDIEERLAKAGLPKDVGFVLEPHLRCGGQFGGYTGSMYQEAIGALVYQLQKAGIGHQLEGRLN